MNNNYLYKSFISKLFLLNIPKNKTFKLFSDTLIIECNFLCIFKKYYLYRIRTNLSLCKEVIFSLYLYSNSLKKSSQN